MEMIPWYGVILGVAWNLGVPFGITPFIRGGRGDRILWDLFVADIVMIISIVYLLGKGIVGLF